MPKSDAQIEDGGYGRVRTRFWRESALCALHSDPNRAAELGRKGGARNRKVYDGDVRNVSVPESAGDVKLMLAETRADILGEPGA